MTLCTLGPSLLLPPTSFLAHDLVSIIFISVYVLEVSRVRDPSSILLSFRRSRPDFWGDTAELLSPSSSQAHIPNLFPLTSRIVASSSPRSFRLPTPCILPLRSSHVLQSRATTSGTT